MKWLRVYPGFSPCMRGTEGRNLQRMKAHSPVSETEDTAAILCVEPLASSSSAPLLLLLRASTVDSSSCLFRERWLLSGMQKADNSNASALPLRPSSHLALCLLLAVSTPRLTSPHLIFNQLSRSLRSGFLLHISTVASFFLSHLWLQAQGKDCAMQ